MKPSQKLLIIAMLAAVTQITAAAGITYKTEDGDYVKLGARIQVQYHLEMPDGGDNADDLIFRRLRPYVEGSLREDWKGKIQIDFGKGDVAIKDIYMQYKGFKNTKITLGNANFPFSQEMLTSSKYQQLVERTFVGDHNYGTPERQVGLYYSGTCPKDMFTLDAGVAVASIDPSNKKLDFDTTAQIDRGDDWSNGPMVGGRVGFHPFGIMKASQGDFKRDVQAAVHVGGFTWQNDDDNLTPVNSNDVDSVTGFEVSASFRGYGLSVDAQYNQFDSELSQANLTDGLYVNSETTLKNYSVEGGFMVVPSKLELVAGYQMQDADGYADTWNRISLGANYFVQKHDIKYQLTYRMGENKDGRVGNDEDELFLQAQYVF